MHGRSAEGQTGLDSHRRDLYDGFGNTLARAVELVATPVLFALAGNALDRRLGTGPVLAVVLVVLAVVGTGAKMYYGYEAAMKEHEANRPWSRRLPGPSA